MRKGSQLFMGWGVPHSFTKIMYSLLPLPFLRFPNYFLPQIKRFLVTTTLMNDWLGSRLKILHITILWKVDGENNWEIYFENQSCWKGGWSMLRSIGEVPISNPLILTLLGQIETSTSVYCYWLMFSKPAQIVCKCPMLFFPWLKVAQLGGKNNLAMQLERPHTLASPSNLATLLEHPHALASPQVNETDWKYTTRVWN